MPASYAHYRFGKLVLPNLPPDARQCISRFRRMFDVGLQGPDFFFYYNPLMKTAVGQLGGQFHSQTGQEFFARACAAATSEAARAYLYGLLGHYCLDSACHPFVQSKVDSGEVRHVALESEFDRYLLEMDGEPSPHTYNISKFLKLTRGECMTVAEFFPGATGANVNRGVRNMIFALNFLSSKNRKGRERLLKLINANLLDNLVPRRGLPVYARMDSELLARFNRQVRHYPEMLRQIQEHMQTDEPLGEDFQATFG